MYDSRAGKNSESTTDDFVEELLVGTAKLIGLLALWAIRFPLVSTPITLSLLATAVIDWRLGIVVAVGFAVGYGGCDNVLIYRVDSGDRNAPPRDELIMRAVAQRIAWRAEYDQALLAGGLPGGQQLSTTV